MFLILMLIAVCFSLSAQSHIEIKGADTSAVIPIKQLRQANAKFIELKACKEENDSLESQIRVYTGMTNNLKASIKELKQANDLNTSIIAGQKRIIDISSLQLKKASRRAKWLVIERNSIAAALVVLIGKIAFFK